MHEDGTSVAEVRQPRPIRMRQDWRVYPPSQVGQKAYGGPWGQAHWGEGPNPALRAWLSCRRGFPGQGSRWIVSAKTLERSRTDGPGGLGAFSDLVDCVRGQRTREVETLAEIAR